MASLSERATRACMGRETHWSLGRSGATPLGKIVSQLLAEALARRKTAPELPKLQWVSRPMHALVALSDKEAMYGVLDRGDE